MKSILAAFPIGSMYSIFAYTYIVDFYGFHVGKDQSHGSVMGLEGFQVET